MTMKIKVNEEASPSLGKADAYLCQVAYKNMFRDFRIGNCRLYRSVADMVKELSGNPNPDLGTWNSGQKFTKAEADAIAKRIMEAVPTVTASGRGYYGEADDAKKHWVSVEAPMYKVWPLNYGEFAPDTAVSVYLVDDKLLTKPEFAAKMKELVSKK